MLVKAIGGEARFNVLRSNGSNCQSRVFWTVYNSAVPCKLRSDAKQVDAPTRRLNRLLTVSVQEAVSQHAIAVDLHRQLGDIDRKKPFDG